ncbi:NUDIX hydrolase [Celerinatantimonas yamalensis]|uniref:NUDIX domain-containing protein n=1 Tax=Celerinatantimonas yamalensis TaxID=559956 RepID=A0ABW9G7F1_9GAMM
MKKLESVAWVFSCDDKVLCVKTKGKDKYFIPGGKLEVSETNEIGLAREIQEELNIKLVPSSIHHVFSVSDMAYGLEDTELEMHCYTAEFTGNLMPDSEIESMKWLDKSQLKMCAPAAQKVLWKVLK